MCIHIYVQNMLIHVWLSLNKAFFDSITLDKAGKNPGFSPFLFNKKQVQTYSQKEREEKLLIPQQQQSLLGLLGDTVQKKKGKGDEIGNFEKDEDFQRRKQNYGGIEVNSEEQQPWCKLEGYDGFFLPSRLMRSLCDVYKYIQKPIYIGVFTRERRSGGNF